MSADKLEVDSTRLRWTVRETSEDLYIGSSKFMFQGGRWQLCYTKSGTVYILHLFRCSGVPPHRPLQVSVSVESRLEGRIVSVLPEVTCFTEDKFEARHDWEVIWKVETAENLRSVPEFRLHGILRLIVVLKVEGSCVCACPNSKTLTDASVQTRLDACSLSSLDTLSEDICKLQNSDLNPDVELRCEGRNARAHRALLSVRSPVLAKMLQADMEEGRTGIVHIRSMDADTFELFLNHLHTGKLEQESLSFDAALHLYKAGKMYQVDSLSGICCQFMVQNLTADNAYDVIVTADEHADSHLTEVATRFMMENHIPRPGSERWEAFCSSYQNLAMKVANRYIKELTDTYAPSRTKHCAN